MTTVTAELVASVLSVSVEPGQKVAAGDELVLLDSMKMEIPVISEVDGVVTAVVVMALALSFIATLYPSWRAARLDPVEALRYE